MLERWRLCGALAHRAPRHAWVRYMLESGSKTRGEGYCKEYRNLKVHPVNKLFSISLAILATATVAGQAWVHGPASPADHSSMHSISRKCPALREALPGERASKYDTITYKDAYWRKRIVDAVASTFGESQDSCRR